MNAFQHARWVGLVVDSVEHEHNIEWSINRQARDVADLEREIPETGGCRLGLAAAKRLLVEVIANECGVWER